MRNPNKFCVNSCKYQKYFVEGWIQINHPLLKGGLLLMKIVLCIEGVFLLRVGRGRVRVGQ